MSFDGSSSGANTSLKNNRDTRRARIRPFKAIIDAYKTSFPSDKLNFQEQSPEEIATPDTIPTYISINCTPKK